MSNMWWKVVVDRFCVLCFNTPSWPAYIVVSSSHLGDDMSRLCNASEESYLFFLCVWSVLLFGLTLCLTTDTNTHKCASGQFWDCGEKVRLEPCTITLMHPAVNNPKFHQSWQLIRDRFKKKMLEIENGLNFLSHQILLALSIYCYNV